MRPLISACPPPDARTPAPRPMTGPWVWERRWLLAMVALLLGLCVVAPGLPSVKSRR